MLKIILEFILGFSIGMAFAAIYQNIPFKSLVGKKEIVIFGLELHHSLIGIFSMILAFFLGDLSSKVLLFSAGIGIIVQHYLYGGDMKFINKKK